MSKPKSKHHAAKSAPSKGAAPKGKPSASKKPAKNSLNMWLIIAAVVVVAGIAAFALLGDQTAADPPKEVSVAQAKEKFDAGAFLLDVRQPEEWNEYHVPGTTLIPLGELASRVDELPQDREIVVICRSGNRSQEGRDILLNAGLTDVTSMAGGVIDWRSAGYPTVTGP